MWFARRYRACRRWQTTAGAEAVQRSELRNLLLAASRTEFGRQHDFGAIRSYEEYRDRVAVASYPDFRPRVERMVAGEANVLWPGHCKRFAQSSGTSDGKSKYIPITNASLRRNHYPGATDAVVHYLHNYPDSRIFSGKGLILGGSFANEIANLPSDVRVGDLSANLIDKINPAVNLMRVPSKEVALMADWHEKLPALVEASLHQNITNISGVPSWFLTVLRQVIERAGASSIHEVWPNLEVFFHGGISFAPYRDQYAAITNTSRMRYVETYNASEGFFAVQDNIERRSMLLLLDLGVFYEFVPLDEIDSPHPRALGAWQVEAGRTYALVISSCNGLWRYAIGDTVRIDTVEPLRVTIAGRTRSFINAFGEELMVHNADAALAETCRLTGASVLNYTAAPVYTTEGARGRHQWLIEWNTPPASIDEFAAVLDHQLCLQNSDYQAKRAGNIFLDSLSITTARSGLFDDWLESTGKLGGQRKVPRLSNSRATIETMISINNQQ